MQYNKVKKIMQRSEVFEEFPFLIALVYRRFGGHRAEVSCWKRSSSVKANAMKLDTAKFGLSTAIVLASPAVTGPDLRRAQIQAKQERRTHFAAAGRQRMRK
jgi:hypothetical protein